MTILLILTIIYCMPTYRETGVTDSIRIDMASAFLLRLTWVG